MLSLGTVVEDPDPIGIWIQYRAHLPSGNTLNASGDARGDGTPHIVHYGGNPLVAWAWNNGPDHDIAFSEWDGSQWMVHPQLFVEADGTLHATWCEFGPQDRVWMSTRSSTTQIWSNPTKVTDAGESGCRPSVAVFGDDLYVAYERDSTEPGMAQDIVVAKSVPGGPFTKELVASTPRTDRLDPVLHVQGSFFWVDWMQGAGMFGCSEDDSGTWTTAEQIAWTDESCIGVESVRREIRRMVVLP
ncbi:hypothetical protein ABI59_05300 [Acidobacteria bacterium Mor1]|nr:hypothetical protein ABI59_05300 [Acidobacteria bacterium Mor1]